MHCTNHLLRTDGESPWPAPVADLPLLPGRHTHSQSNSGQALGEFGKGFPETQRGTPEIETKEMSLLSTPGVVPRSHSDCPLPKDVHEVRNVLGFFSYYRHFIPHYSEIPKPLVKLTEKERPFTWDEEQQKSFHDLKEMLSQAPILVHPQPEGDFMLDTDASNEGSGAVLSQVQDGQEKVITYLSKMLSKTERNYCITRCELLAVVHFVTQFKHFLIGRHFLVRTDF